MWGIMSEQKQGPREWWLDSNVDHYYDDTDENLLAGGFVLVIEKSAYDALLKQAKKLRDVFQSVHDGRLAAPTIASSMAIADFDKFLEEK
jgi:hypothetical protein